MGVWMRWNGEPRTHRIDGEGRGELQHAVFNPLPTMPVTLTGTAILAAEKGATHAAGAAMVEVVKRAFQRAQGLLWLGHISLLDIECPDSLA